MSTRRTLPAASVLLALLGCGSAAKPPAHIGGGAGRGGGLAGASGSNPGQAGDAGGPLGPGDAGADGASGGATGIAASGGSNAATGGTPGSGGDAAGTGGLVGTGGNPSTGGNPGAAGSGGATAVTGPIDPNWAGWRMPNNPLDVAAGAPNPMAYTDDGDGTVTDQVTGLVWQQTPPSSQYTWNSAKTYCSTLSGLTARQWRLPTAIELASLLDDSVGTGPTINAAAFPGTPAAGYFWSATRAAGETGQAWGVGFNAGYVDTYTTSSTFYVRCVAADPNVSTDAGAPPGRYTLVNATMYDAGTQLTWQEFVPADEYTWDDAKAYCASAQVAALGGTGWRLPTKKELLTLVDFSVGPSGPTIDATAFASTPADNFWTASQVAGSSASSAWRVYFGVGYPDAQPTSETAYVRCVH